MYALGCRYFVYDSESQYELLCRLSPEAKKIVRLNMRFTSPHDLVYGLYPEEIQEMAQRGMLPDGYTFHLAERDHCPEITTIKTQRRPVPRCMRCGSSPDGQSPRWK